jgi:hypothetical protein
MRADPFLKILFPFRPAGREKIIFGYAATKSHFMKIRFTRAPLKNNFHTLRLYKLATS